MSVQMRGRGHRPRARRGPKRAPPSGRAKALDDRPGPAEEPSAELSVHVSRCSPRPVITVVGALDARGAALVSAMLDHVRRSDGRAAEVDLSRVAYADRHGLGPLLDRCARIRRASPVVTRLLAAMDRCAQWPAEDAPAQ